MWDDISRVYNLLTAKKFAKIFKVAYEIVPYPLSCLTFRQFSPLRVGG